MSTTPHPSVAAPKCVECVHHVIAPMGHNPKAHCCSHPIVPRSLVTGYPTQICNDMRTDRPAGYMVPDPCTGFVDMPRCGTAGQLFEPAPQPDTP